MLKPFEAKRPEGRQRLLELLSRIMIRAAKSDLFTIPPLLTKVHTKTLAQSFLPPSLIFLGIGAPVLCTEITPSLGFGCHPQTVATNSSIKALHGGTESSQPIRPHAVS